MSLRSFDPIDEKALAAFLTDSSVGVLPVAATEQHGPHLPVTTDSDIARGHLAALPTFLQPELSVAVLPLQTVGYSAEHSAFPGLVSGEPEELLAEWGRMARKFHDAGGRRLVIVSSHGGNSPVVDILIRRLRVDLKMLAVATSWMRFGQPANLFTEWELAHGIHGGDIETSLMLHYAPGSVRRDKWQKFMELRPTPDKNPGLLSRSGPHRYGWMSQDLNATGVVGDAALATAEKGAASARHALESFAKLLAEVAAFDLGRLR